MSVTARIPIAFFHNILNRAACLFVVCTKTRILFATFKNLHSINTKSHNEEELKLLQTEVGNGNSAAFTQLYGLFFKRLYTFSFSIVRVPETATEVVEDVFIKLWMKRQIIQSVENLSVYLYVSVKNQSLNRLAAKASQWKAMDIDELVPDLALLEEDPLGQIISKETLQKFNQAVEDLPPRCKMIFKLVREDGLRYQEVSDILNISINTIDVQMATAVKRISQSLGLAKKRPVSFFSRRNKKN
ncbi:RNA polymerase sigma-70 factor [Niabella insulamsoli]|uniref:RNA polymerase sigma-70 factor n=1 Tax=Niabella insulamsoli TaxID=3144874 RepID=UPI0031FD97A2